MSTIRFMNVPKKQKEEHKILIGRRLSKTSKPLEIPDANQKVQKVAEIIAPESSIKLDIEVDPENGSNKTYAIKDVTITADDKYRGLRGIADRLSQDDDSTTALAVANLIEDELRANDDSSLSEELDYLPEQEDRKDYTDDKTNYEERSIGSVAPAVTTEAGNEEDNSTPELDSVEEHENKESTENDLAVQPNPDDFLGELLPEHKETNSVEEESIIPRAAYTKNQQDFFVDVAATDSLFDLENIRKSLGYLENPTNEYQRQLNAAIMRNIEKCQLKSTTAQYEAGLNKLKRQALDDLDNVYSEVNQGLLEDTANAKAGNELKQNVAKAAMEKQANQKELEDKKAAYATEVDDHAAKEIAEATERIMTEASHKKEAFAQHQDTLLEKRNRTIDEDLTAINSQTKTKYRQQEVQERNEKLKNKSIEIKNRYLSAQESLFQESKENFRENVNHLEKNVQSAAKNIERQRRKDERAQLIEKQHEAKIIKLEEMARLQKQSNELIEKQNQLKERELEQNGSSQLASNISASVAGAVKDALNKENEELVEDTAQSEETNKLGHELSKPTRRLRVAGLISLGVIAALGAGWGYHTHQVEQQPNQSMSLKRNNNKKPLQSTAKISPTDETISNGKDLQRIIKKQQKANDSNVVRYYAAKNWAAKIDVLDGALGQGDIRALKQINDRHSTWISELYYAIAANDQTKVRLLYLKLKPEQKQKLSAAAKHAIALAYYNVYDWGNGWNARNGY